MYTEIRVRYPGLDFTWQRHDVAKKEARAETLTIDPKGIDDVSVTIPIQRLGDFEIKASTTRSMILEWAGSSALTNDFDDSLEVFYVRFRFRGEKPESVHVTGYFMDQNAMRITKNGKSIMWPCSPDELKNVLGEPLSYTEKQEEVSGY
jgi:hypothetical protein